MTKLYRRFQSAVDRLITDNYFWLRSLCKAIYSEEEYDVLCSGSSFTLNHQLIISAKEQMIGALQPLFDAKREIVKTFQPYRSKIQALKDLLQPLRGLINIIQGMVSIVIALLSFAIYTPFITLMECCAGGPHVENYLRDEALMLPFSWLMHGVLKICQGAAQIATTTLTWFLRMPLRAALTAKYGYADFMQADGMKKLLAFAGDENMSNRDFSHAKRLVNSKLAMKFSKAQKAGSKMLPGLDLTQSAFGNLYCITYTQNYLNGAIMMQLLPDEIKPYFLMNKFMRADIETRKALIGTIDEIMKSNISLNHKLHSVINVIEPHGLYNLHLLTIMAHRNTSSSLRQLVKPVAGIIANMTMFRNVPRIEANEMDKITHQTPLLRHYN